MPNPRVIRRRQIPQDFVQYLQEYLLNRSMREKSTFNENTHKAVLMDVLDQVGIPQEGGHKTIGLDDPLTYHHYTTGDHVVEKKVKGIERRRRYGLALNEERVMAYLEQHNLLARCTTTVTVIDEDEVLAAAYDGTIPDDDMKALYDENETFAFYLTTD